MHQATDHRKRKRAACMVTLWALLGSSKWAVARALQQALQTGGNHHSCCCSSP